MDVRVCDAANYAHVCVCLCVLHKAVLLWLLEAGLTRELILSEETAPHVHTTNMS